MRAFVFPGQGSQKVGMGKDLVAEYPLAKEIYDIADKTLGFSLSGLSFEGPEEELTKTQNAQVALLTYSHAVTEILKSKGVTPGVVAGHSLGEFSAILAAGMVSFEQMLKIVRKRGELMSQADPSGKGGMAAVLGMDDAKVKELCAEISKTAYVEPVNYNSPGQVVISGLKEGIDIAEVKLKEAGAKRVLKLAVSGAFHSELMKAAAQEFGAFLQTIEWKKPGCKVIANVTAGELNETNVVELLTKQMHSPVLWTDSVKALKALGVNEAVEAGYGAVVSGLVKKIDETIVMKAWKEAIA